MSDAEKLNAIEARCRELLTLDCGSDSAEAGWRSTIAAIERLQKLHRSSLAHQSFGKHLERDILTAWEGLV